MKTEVNNIDRNIKVTFLCCIQAIVALFFAGCNIFGFLASEGPFESKKAPEFNLLAQQDRKILVWLETPRSLNISDAVQGKLRGAFNSYLSGQMKIKPANIVLAPASGTAGTAGMQDPANVARSLGAGFVLLVQVDMFELDSLQIKDYVTGQLITRTILLDADSSTAVWPKQPEGKMIHIGVEVETGGRDAAISRLVSAATHCTLRYLYPCDKLKFKNSDERVSTQEAFEIETY